MTDFMKGIVFLAVLFYIISPVDLVPGPIDDLILLAMTVASRKGIANE